MAGGLAALFLDTLYACIAQACIAQGEGKAMGWFCCATAPMTTRHLPLAS